MSSVYFVTSLSGLYPRISIVLRCFSLDEVRECIRDEAARPVELFHHSDRAARCAHQTSRPSNVSFDRGILDENAC